MIFAVVDSFIHFANGQVLGPQVVRNKNVSPDLKYSYEHCQYQSGNYSISKGAKGKSVATHNFQFHVVHGGLAVNPGQHGVLEWRDESH